MSPTFHLLLLIAAIVCFGLATWMSVQPEPVWKRLTSLGLTLLAASMIAW